MRTRLPAVTLPMGTLHASSSSSSSRCKVHSLLGDIRSRHKKFVYISGVTIVIVLLLSC
jgi:hypothetical protein